MKVSILVLAVVCPKVQDGGKLRKRKTRKTFDFILRWIQADIEKSIVTELPLSPECRLAI